MTMQKLGDIFDEWMDANQEGRSHWIGPSGLKDCYRQQAYTYCGVAPTDEVSKAKADLGTLIHLGWSAMIRAKGDPLHACDVEVDWGGPRKGSVDDVHYGTRTVSDLKSPNARSFQWWLDHGPPQGYVDQLQVYAHGLEMLHPGGWTCRIVGICSETGARHAWEFPYDPDRAAELVASANDRHAALMRAASVAELLDDDAAAAVAEEFPREGHDPSKFPCGWCEFRSRCWPQPTAPDRSPMSETVAGDPVEILGHAEGYMAAKAEESKWKKVADTHRGYLAGLDGEYESPDGQVYRVAMVGGFQGADVPDLDALVEAFEEMGMEVPMKPSRPSARYVRVNRRAAG
jgi:hypothetical protein